jgi:hypothetical protein
MIKKEYSECELTGKIIVNQYYYAQSRTWDY